MAVYHAGGGFLGGLGKALSFGSMFIPGLQPIAAGANMIGGIANGDPMAAIMGGLGMMKGADGKPLLGGDGGLFGKLFGGGQKQPQVRSSFMDALKGAHNIGMGEAEQAPGWGEELESWSRATPPQFARHGNFRDMYDYTGGAGGDTDTPMVNNLRNDRFKQGNPWGFRY